MLDPPLELAEGAELVMQVVLAGCRLSVGGAGGDGPVDAGAGGADGGPSPEELSYQAFQACGLTPVIRASMVSDDNNQTSSFDVEAVRVLLEALRDRVHAKYVVDQTETFGERTTWTHVFVITPEGSVSRASQVQNRYDTYPPTYAFTTARCSLLEASVYQICLDSLESGPWPNCAFELFNGCQDQAVLCE